MKTVSAAQFKKRCIAFLNEVERTQVPLVVTCRGQPLARVSPITVTADYAVNVLRDSIEFESDIVTPTGADWRTTVDH